VPSVTPIAIFSDALKRPVGDAGDGLCMTNMGGRAGRSSDCLGGAMFAQRWSRLDWPRIVSGAIDDSPADFLDWMHSTRFEWTRTIV
jgi:hypothetical protein